MSSYHVSDWTRLYDRGMSRAYKSPAPLIERPATVTVERPSQEQIERKVANFKLVADALEFLLSVWPEIPGASVTLAPAQQDELKRIVLALPASVEL